MAACSDVQHWEPGSDGRGSDAGLVHHGRVRVQAPAQRRPQFQAGPVLLAAGRLRLLHPVPCQVGPAMSTISCLPYR